MHSKGLERSLAVLFAINILNFYDRQVLGALLEPIRKEFHLSDTQLGLSERCRSSCTRWSGCR